MICYTYDYELFFKISGTVEKCLIQPTDLILDFFKKNNQCGTFFVDAIFLERLKEVDEEKTAFAKIVSQLQRMVLEGSRIELHLHPHWLDAEYLNGSWHFPHYLNYQIQSLSQYEIRNIFTRTTHLLNSIAREVDPSYSVHCYRAGGWCIQPFEKLYNPFLENEIYVDSSVCLGIKEENIRNYDFTNFRLENSKYWNFDLDPLLENKDGGLTEIPIHSIKRNFATRIFRRLFQRGDSYFGDGSGLVFSHTIPKFKLLLSWFKNSQVMFSTDDISSFEIKRFLKSYQPNNIYVVINHPKCLRVQTGLHSYEDMKSLETITLYDFFKRINRRQLLG